MRAAILLLAAPSIASAAEETHGGGEDYTVLKWVYAGILVAGIVWAWRKFVTPAFHARGETIRKDLDSARKMKAEADRRVEEIEARLKNLSGEVQAFRDEATRLIEGEAKTILEETAEQTARMRQRTEREIRTIAKGAVAAIRAEAAQQAVELARQRIAEGLPRETHRGLIAGFLSDLERSRN